MSGGKQSGVLVISLDFELYWGMRDKKPLADYQDSLLGVYKVVPQLLELFSEYGIHATWATVGFLFFENFGELRQALPERAPAYINSRLSPYVYIDQIEHKTDRFHFAPSLLKVIASFPGQEIASHTFSHYYCLEAGQDTYDFESDLDCALAVARRWGLALDSLVFPRNQYALEHVRVCRRLGIRCYRGNSPSWIYRAANKSWTDPFKRALRLLDAYVNVTGGDTYEPFNLNGQNPLNVPASRFLRPYSRMFAGLDFLKLRRIANSLTHAAKTGRIYHLWWHPHNFGTDRAENLAFLRRVLDHFSCLRDLYGIESLNMGELAERYKVE